MRDGAMELFTTEPDADGRRKRMRFAAIAADRFEWTWSRSAADGWDELWRIDYTRATA